MPVVKTGRRRTGEGIVMVSVEEIDPNPFQPRQRVNRRALEELADSIARYGVLSPPSVRRRCGRYELVAGERRLRAARLAGLGQV
ncbi:MAG: ParB/RepB/Spo0J family partition protein, partial [Oscillospiraceae bacterium]|nr:ParB/RepB/Spo0J family partition protein [Oscillospiraceae bacterium]